MFRNYLKLAVNHMLKHRLYTMINIMGLAIGLACCILIFLYVRFELSYESNFDNTDRLYRISIEYFPVDGARLRTPAQNRGPVAQALLENFEQIESAGRIYSGNVALQLDETVIQEPAVRYVDHEIVQMFNFTWLQGDPSTALDEPNSIILTESLARKYFGSTEVLGDTLQVPDVFTLRVTGVIEDLPGNTHLSLSGMVSMSTMVQVAGPEFGYTDFHTYFQLREGESIEPIQTAIPDFLDRYIIEYDSSNSTMRIMNIGDIHLHSDRDEEWLPPGNIANVYSFSAIAFGILLIACINFMSIATARSSQRSKEVGARLALGASRRQLIVQFLGEAFITAFFAFILAVALAEVLLPGFSAFIGDELSFDLQGDIGLSATLLALVVFTALFSGSYPAFYLSGQKPNSVLKGALSQSGNSLWLRNIMVVLQFSIAIALVISTAVISLQRQYVNKADLGFERDNIVVLPGSAVARIGYGTEWAAFREALLQNPAIESVTTSHFLPFGWNDFHMPFRRTGTSVEHRIQFMQVHTGFFSTYGIDTVAGRVFSPEIASDAMRMPTGEDSYTRVSLVLNQAAAQMLDIGEQQFTNQALSKITLDIDGGVAQGQVLGIVEDTYFESLRREVRPLVFVFSSPGHPRNLEGFFNAAIRINPNATAEALDHIDATWVTFYPDSLNRRYFLQQDFLAMYESETRQQQLLTWFSTLAIVIACFGLFGLASFNAERRTKEIGIRKVMGSSVWSIVLLLTNDFSKLVLVSNVFAWPLAYFSMNRWLEGFAYRIDLSPLIFIGSALIALCIAWVTVGGTAAKAATQKPVLTLRYE